MLVLKAVPWEEKHRQTNGAVACRKEIATREDTYRSWVAVVVRQRIVQDEKDVGRLLAFQWSSRPTRRAEVQAVDLAEDLAYRGKRTVVFMDRFKEKNTDSRRSTSVVSRKWTGEPEIRLIDDWPALEYGMDASRADRSYPFPSDPIQNRVNPSELHPSLLCRERCLHDRSADSVHIYRRERESQNE